MAAIISISSTSFHSDHRILECRSLFYQLKARVDNFILKWIPSHCGVSGNHAADCPAEKGYRDPTVLPSTCPESSPLCDSEHAQHLPLRPASSAEGVWQARELTGER
ncbi:hypothetical protein CDAR_201531 [Caerostris darwini]|uniref:RNase H type-1 domain-containing protein n=1 Tax=Caerostris darwini TaxID=1538125 RepID=A0AAV4TEH1_9ARAC|nr:hypothetical protein CDAR_201531 [Caerostris darwini]